MSALPHSRTPAPNTDLENELIEFFVHLADMLSMPHSLGQIFGLLYASAEPLCFEEIQTRLEISKGSTSNGLKSLREMGAIKVIPQASDRRDFYTCEHSLRKLAEAFLSTRLLPHLENGKDRITRMETLLQSQEGKDPHLESAISSLKTWMKKANMLIPLMKKLVR